MKGRFDMLKQSRLFSIALTIALLVQPLSLGAQGYPPNAGILAVAQKDGEMVVVEEFPARPIEVFASLAASIAPRETHNQRYRSRPVSRPAVSIEQTDAARDWAHSTLQAAASTFASLPEYDAQSDAQKQIDSRTRTQISLALDILVGVGRPEDANRLYAVAKSRLFGDDLYDALMKNVAVDIWQLWDVVVGSPMSEDFAWADPADIETYKLAERLAVTGYRPAIDYIHQVVAVERRHEANSNINAMTALPYLFLERDPETDALFRDILTNYNTHIAASLNDVAYNLVMDGIPVRAAGWLAFVYLAGEQGPTPTFLLPQWNSFSARQASRLLARPEDYLRHILGLTTQDYFGIKFNDTDQIFCIALSDRDWFDKNEITERFSAMVQDYIDEVAEGDRRTQYAANSRLIWNAAHWCHPSYANMDTLGRDDPYAIPGWLHGFTFRLEDWMKKNDSIQPRFYPTYSFDPADPVKFSNVITAAEWPDREGIILRQASVKAAHQNVVSPFAATTDTRFAVGPFSEPDSTGIWIATRLELQPFAEDGGLLFGLDIEANVHVENALAEKISGRLDQIDGYLADGALKLIRSVSLRTGDAVVPLDLLETLEDGLHIYATPGAVENAGGLIVDVTLGGLGPEWTVSFPLADSPFGFRARYYDGSLAAHIVAGSE
jgi:hypothetical protein